MNFMWFSFEYCHGISNTIFQISRKKVNIGTEIIILINLYMHSLTLEEEQHSKMRNVPRKYFVYASSVYFRNFIYWVLKCGTIYVNYILLWLFLDELFQEKTNTKTAFNGKRYESMVCSMYVVTSGQGQVWQKQFHSHVISI